HQAVFSLFFEPNKKNCSQRKAAARSCSGWTPTWGVFMPQSKQLRLAVVLGSTQQTIIAQRLSDACFTRGIQRAQRQAEFAGAAAQELQGGLDGNRVRGHSEHIPTEREEPAMPLLRLVQAALVERLNHRLEVARHNVA